MTVPAAMPPTPESVRNNDVWDMTAFGLRGRLDFTNITQDWLREATKLWVENDLPRHRGRRPHAAAREMIAAVVELSESLRLARDDRGADPTQLGRRDIITFTNRLAHKERTNQLTPYDRRNRLSRARRFLREIRETDATAGLPDDVVLTRADIPTEPDPDDTRRALPEWVFQIISNNLAVLEQRSGVGSRRMVELMMDTGRRPDEICRLPFHCLQRDSSDKPVLIYTNSKTNRPDQRLPIGETTARIIHAQQARVRAMLPDTSLTSLMLFPRGDRHNPAGTEPTDSSRLSAAHRGFVTAIAHLFHGKPGAEDFCSSAIVPYAYRHTYAQRHADQGVAPDVLRELMGHGSLQTTLQYYRVTENRAREAVDRVSAHQFDGSGQRAFRGIASLLADEHARLRVGRVSVPFGVCTESSNVKAGGQVCRYKFSCLGCGHFRSDPAHLPELASYLQRLLAERERLHAAKDPGEWAGDTPGPSDREIANLRAMIRRIEAEVDELTNEDRAHIYEAVNAVHKMRQMVSLPSVEPPATGEAK